MIKEVTSSTRFISCFDLLASRQHVLQLTECAAARSRHGGEIHVEMVHRWCSRWGEEWGVNDLSRW